MLEMEVEDKLKRAIATLGLLGALCANAQSKESEVTYPAECLGVAQDLPCVAPAAASDEETSSTRQNIAGGIWLVTATREDGTTFLSLMTYIPRGQVLEESNTAGIRSLAHGKWVRTGRRQFTRTFIIFRFDATRQYLGTNLNAATIELSDDGNTYRAAARANLYDADGQLVGTSTLVENGRRMDPSEFPDPPELQ